MPRAKSKESQPSLPKLTSETDIFHQAVRHWWNSKQPAGAKRSAGKQGGARDANLHGKTMDGFAEQLRGFLVGLGVKSEHIFLGGHLSTAPSILPSYFRPSKNWDLIVLGSSRFHPAPGDEGDPVLYAAVEFKSQDKSIGNNQNNRLEESIGNAHDFWVTYAQSGFVRQQPRPWLGYLFVGNYKEDSDNKPVQIKQPHFLAMELFRGKNENTDKPVFAGPSYSERYRLFLKQSVGARLYDSGVFIVTDDGIAMKRTNHRIPLAEFGPANFLRSLKAQILAHYPGASIKPNTLAALI
ncbi:hypothetical protein M2447_000171 [Ereboglobus sp. PH5-10]|uniref:PaeR7I family type II restriction endonuclease n=1 Tax=Ereboglobus sp. PH5-10 TaxID=2940629 RepID=UPI00240664A2|nr:PaeR7I family type II restriction endonuclease [Ereboglobus sp. PH5-10]MDF9826095.1 hypothetical protein [Ereboglobus sp. PH5-10]